VEQTAVMLLSDLPQLGTTINPVFFGATMRILRVRLRYDVVNIRIVAARKYRNIELDK